MKNIFSVIGLCLCCFLLIQAFCGCKPTTAVVQKPSVSALEIFQKEVSISKVTLIENEVIIYPGAFLKTTGSGKFIFGNRVTMIGESHVFDVNSNFEFAPGTISELNPCWFGARGSDEADDTRAIQTALDLAKDYASS